jgi:hypothetical protein
MDAIKHRSDGGFRKSWASSKLSRGGQVTSSEIPYVSYSNPVAGIMKKMIVILFTLASIQCFGQIFDKREIQQGIAKLKTNQYSGTGGGGYWNLKYYDEKGRMIIEELYKRNTLMGRHAYEYDQFDNEILFISLYDINNPNRNDTVSYTKYYYNSNGQIEKELTTVANSKFTTKIISKRENLTIYQKISEHYWKREDTINVDTTVIKLIYGKNGFILKQVKENMEDKSIEITDYTYYQNGKLLRRKISRILEPEFSSVYVGGPGSDDMSYDYKYTNTKKDRLKTLYTIVEGKKYKLAKYRYEEW